MNLQDALIASGPASTGSGSATGICAAGKVSYATKQDAMARMRRFRRNSGSRSWQVYRCSVCGQYHLTGGGSK